MVIVYDDIIEETKLAYRIQFGENDDPKYGDPIWIPKSCIISLDEEVQEVDLLDWIVFEKGLEAFGI